MYFYTDKENLLLENMAIFNLTCFYLYFFIDIFKNKSSDI